MHHSLCCGSTLRTEPSLPSSTISAMPPSSNSGRSDPIKNNINQAHNHAESEAKINDLIAQVGHGICGILHKWVNYGKGWRPRWFVLEDGVLSYYTIHGPDKIVINHDSVKGFKVIGDDSLRRINRFSSSTRTHSSHTNMNHNNCNNIAGGNYVITHLNSKRKPLGEVHLKVSSIRESRSDDKRFSIFTGTKRLHLRADTQEGRMAWLEALHAVKGLFPRMSNSDLMAPIENITLSTEKLRQRLLEEGVSEAAIQDSEQIMRTEFASMQNQLVLVRQKHWLLIDTLRNFETEKIDLENTIVDENQRKLKEVGQSSRSNQVNYSEATSASEFKDDNERIDTVEEETDDEDNAFFDTRDFLSSSSLRSSGSDS